MIHFGDYLGFLIKSRYVIDMSKFSDAEVAILNVQRRKIPDSEELSACQLHVMRAEEIYENWAIVRGKFVELGKDHLEELTGWAASSIEGWVGSMGASCPSDNAANDLKGQLRLSHKEEKFYEQRFAESQKAGELFRNSLKCPKFILALIDKADLPKGPKQGKRPPITSAAERCGMERTTLSGLTTGRNIPIEDNIKVIVSGLGFNGETLLDVFGNQAAGMASNPEITIEEHFLKLMAEDNERKGREKKEMPTPIARALEILLQEKSVARIKVPELCKGDITTPQLDNWFAGATSPHKSHIDTITSALNALEKREELYQAAAETRIIIRDRARVPEGEQSQTTGILRGLTTLYRLSQKDLGLAGVTVAQRFRGVTDHTIELESIFRISGSEKIPPGDKQELEKALFLGRHQDILLRDAARKPGLNVPMESFADVSDDAKPRLMTSAERLTEIRTPRDHQFR